jgi:hypothetical protein
MDKQALIKKLKVLQENGDTENDHIDADDLLIEYINDKEIEEAYEAIDKWYA